MVNSNLLSISKAGFIFCRFTVAVILWAALLLQVKWLVFLSFFFLASSAILGLKRAPLIVLYTSTINRIIPSSDEVVDGLGIRFAQSLGAVLNLLCLVFLYFINEPVGWAMVFVVAVLKTLGAMGFCGGLKLYQCMFGNCCPILQNQRQGK